MYTAYKKRQLIYKSLNAGQLCHIWISNHNPFGFIIVEAGSWSGISYH
jgi:hypothetical protein